MDRLLSVLRLLAEVLKVKDSIYCTVLPGKAAFTLSERTGSGHVRGSHQLLFDANLPVSLPYKH